MSYLQTIRAAALGLAALAISPPLADAAPKRFFDPNTKAYIVYDPGGQAEARARPKTQARPQRQAVRPERRTAMPQRLATLPQRPERLRFRSFDEVMGAPQGPRLARLPATRPMTLEPEASHPQPGPEFDRQIVQYETTEKPGTIVIDTGSKFLYYVMEGGEAIRYGVGVGKEGFGWTGTVEVGALQEWPKWFPPSEMVQRRPELAKYKGVGMEGGEGNPLGARALYLHDNGKDTLFRIHGTNEPWSIGQNMSSGCIRMLNENVIELYSMAKIGAKVIVT